MKALALVVALLCLATGAFAADFGIGVSGAYYMSDLKASAPGSTFEMLGTSIPIDFMAFIDLTYLQLAAGYQMVNGSHLKTTTTGPSSTTDVDNKGTLGFISFAGYFKYPIRLGSITLFPMLGVEYDMNIIAKDGSGNDLRAFWTDQQKTDANELFIKGGLGADISVTPKFYIRPELIVGYKLLSKGENDQIAALKFGGATDASILDLSFELAVLFGVRL